MTDWDRYLPQRKRAYNTTQHFTTGISPHMMLTGHEKALTLTFFYPEYEGKQNKTKTQVQARQRKPFKNKATGAKVYSVGDYVWVFQNVIPPKRMKKLLKEWR